MEKDTKTPNLRKYPLFLCHAKELISEAISSAATHKVVFKHLNVSPIVLQLPAQGGSTKKKQHYIA